jgi:hypothetical protein
LTKDNFYDYIKLINLIFLNMTSENIDSDEQNHNVLQGHTELHPPEISDPLQRTQAVINIYEEEIAKNVAYERQKEIVQTAEDGVRWSQDIVNQSTNPITKAFKKRQLRQANDVLNREQRALENQPVPDRTTAVLDGIKEANERNLPRSSNNDQPISSDDAKRNRENFFTQQDNHIKEVEKERIAKEKKEQFTLHNIGNIHKRNAAIQENRYTSVYTENIEISLAENDIAMLSNAAINLVLDINPNIKLGEIDFSLSSVDIVEKQHNHFIRYNWHDGGQEEDARLEKMRENISKFEEAFGTLLVTAQISQIEAREKGTEFDIEKFLHTYNTALEVIDKRENDWLEKEENNYRMAFKPRVARTGAPNIKHIMAWEAYLSTHNNHGEFTYTYEDQDKIYSHAYIAALLISSTLLGQDRYQLHKYGLRAVIAFNESTDDTRDLMNINDELQNKLVKMTGLYSALTSFKALKAWDMIKDNIL